MRFSNDSAPSMTLDAHPSWAGRLVLTAIVLAVAVGCEKSGDSTDKTSGPSGPTSRVLEASSEELPEEPQRIVSLAPNITETLFALDVGDRVVAVTNFCDYPPQVESLPSIGSFSNPDFETILSKKPDLVLGITSGGDQSVADKLKDAGVPFAFLRTYTVQDTMDMLEAVGDLVGRPEAGRELVQEIRGEFEKIRQEHANKAVPTLLVYGHDPLVAAGPGTFGHQLLEMAGGKNVVGDSDKKFPRLDLEKVLALQPERIIDTSMRPEQADGSFWDKHTAVEAVQSGGVVHLTDPVVLRPGPRIDEGLRRIARALHGSEGDSR
jgi:iron complex transport system substrate-binding protein